MDYGTPFDETEALLAAQSGNTIDLQQIVSRMLPGELAELRRACRLLESEIVAREAGRR
jgi:hypothetical protein